MKKLIQKGMLLVIAVAVLSSLAASMVLADGMIIEQDPYSDRWDYSGEENQQAIIDYQDGMQKMVIGVGLDGAQQEGAVWLFPVPALPDKVAIDVIDKIPTLEGENISLLAKSQVDDMYEDLASTQIYTFPLTKLSGSAMLETRDGNFMMNVPGSKSHGAYPDVTVYEHLEKEGITSEIITAKTANGLYHYLRGKGLKIEDGALKVLDKYIGQDYSFVASWITNQTMGQGDVAPSPLAEMPPDGERNYRFDPYNKGGSNRGRPATANKNIKGLRVDFPTDEIYFPLLPTSVYGSKVVPATVRVIGHVSPHVFRDIKSYTTVEYYIDQSSDFPYQWKPNSNISVNSREDVRYTKISINAPSKLFTDDLWISRQVPLKTFYSTFFAIYPEIGMVLLLMTSSVLTAVLIGWFLFRPLMNRILVLAGLGLTNCLSILGLIAATIMVRTADGNPEGEAAARALRAKGYHWKRVIAFLLFLVSSPFLFLSVLVVPVAIQDLLKDFSFIDEEVLIVMVIALVLFLPALFLRRVKPEDKALFETLRTAKYSVWSFQPKDNRKPLFIILFSITFLIIAALLVKLVQSSV